jgi:uncharacterized protein YcbX
MPNAGLLFDRNWVIVSKDKGAFVTQRTTPSMSQITTQLPDEALTLADACGLRSLPAEACLTLAFPGMPSLQVPLKLDPDIARRPQTKDDRFLSTARVWEWAGAVLDEGGMAAEWLSSVLQTRVRCAAIAAPQRSAS